MSIQTLIPEAIKGEHASANLVKCVDPSSGDVTVDFEVTCDVCERYFCTHLSQDEAHDEVQEHDALVHGPTS